MHTTTGPLKMTDASALRAIARIIWQCTELEKPLKLTDASGLLAILISARRVGDRILQTAVRRELEQQHKIKIQFVRGRPMT